MANILGTQTLDSLLILATDVNPSTVGGTVAPIGSFGSAVDGSGLFTKIGALDTDWTKVLVATAAQVTTRIAYYDANGLTGDANFVWDSATKSIKIGVATTTAYLSVLQTDVSIAGVTTWINFNENGRDAQKDAFVLTTTKSGATGGSTDIVMRSRGAGTTSFTMLNDGTEWLAFKLVDGVGGLSSASTSISINKSFKPNADSTIDLGTTTRAWRTLFIGSGGGVNGVINQLGNAAGSATNFPILLGDTRDDGAANKSAMIITGNVDYTATHYLSIRGGVTNSVLWTVGPGGRTGIGLGGATGTVTSPTAFLDVIGSTALFSSFRIRSSVTPPAAPNNGDFWNDGTDISLNSGFKLIGNLKLSVAGNGILIKEGVNATMGTATLVAGTIVVSTTKALTTSRIFFQVKTAGGVSGFLSYTIVNGTSFTVTSSSVTDTSTFSWVILEPAA